MSQDWLKENEPLSRHTYYRIGGAARYFALPASRDDLVSVSELIRERKLDFVIIGSGSNLLVSDQGFDGLAIRATRLNQDIVKISESTIQTGSGVAVTALLRRCAQEGWAGLEFLTGIPGSIGGVVTMNAGTHLGEAKDALVAVEAFLLNEGRFHRYEREALKFSYRKNHFLPPDALIWSAEWKFTQGDSAVVKSKIDETLARRKATQPLDFPSCGSVFKNPPVSKESGLSAWQVIDKLGLRGHRIGDAQFSEKHPNFILNVGSAKAVEVRALIELAQERAKTELDIVLEKEVIFVGYSR